MGHFVCFDRLGGSSKKERENGMRSHGEAAYVEWRLLSGPEHRNGAVTISMSCELPMARMRLTRTMRLLDDFPVFVVHEEIENIGMLGRIYNMVQHPTIGGAFLDNTLLIDSNAGKGFYLGTPYPELGEPVINWPHFVYESRLVDIRRVEKDHMPGVVNFIFDDDSSIGWVSACSRSGGLMIGYVWKAEEYPWLRIWRANKDGNPTARGLEFGTTPLPLPFGQLLEKGPMLDRPVYQYLDAGERVTRSYAAFLAEIPDDFAGVESLSCDSNGINLRESAGQSARTVTIRSDVLSALSE